MSETRWLSDEEQGVWRSFNAAVSMLRAHLEGQLQHDSAMPHTYYEVLVALSEAAGQTLRMSELADACQSSRSRLSHAVSRLETSGWVHRGSCPTDKRGALASLTPKGLEALKEAAPGHVEAVRQSVFDVLTAEQVSALGEISASIRAGLAPRCELAREAENDTCTG